MRSFKDVIIFVLLLSSVLKCFVISFQSEGALYLSLDHRLLNFLQVL